MYIFSSNYCLLLLTTLLACPFTRSSHVLGLCVYFTYLFGLHCLYRIFSFQCSSEIFHNRKVSAHHSRPFRVRKSAHQVTFGQALRLCSGQAIRSDGRNSIDEAIFLSSNRLGPYGGYRAAQLLRVCLTDPDPPVFEFLPQNPGDSARLGGCYS